MLPIDACHSETSVDLQADQRLRPELTVAVTAYINRIGTAVPPNDVHRAFVERIPRMLSTRRAQQLFCRMAERSEIEHRYSIFKPSPASNELDVDGVFTIGTFPDMRKRMELFEHYAPDLALEGVSALSLRDSERPSHLVITTCTGFYAPGIDLEIVRRLGLDGGIERTVIGFMGCYAAINALKVAHHIVRSEPAANVLIVNLEICTLHFQKTENLPELLSFLIFADGCAASLISARPVGAEILGFAATVVPESGDQITWRVGREGFDMYLAGAVPTTIARALPGFVKGMQNRFRIDQLPLWAVHPGGRSILDAVEHSLDLPPDALAPSRDVLRRYGNMSSPTVMFALKAVINDAPVEHAGTAIAFGPGLTTEAMLFRTAGGPV